MLDIGAGESPYRELFHEHEYLTLDRADTPHSGEVDMHGEADSIPVEDGSFDVVLCTQVLALGFGVRAAAGDRMTAK